MLKQLKRAHFAPILTHFERSNPSLLPSKVLHRAATLLCPSPEACNSFHSLQGSLAHPELGELHPPLPVVHVRALSIEKKEERSVYLCPVYVTAQRGYTYSFTAQLRTRDPVHKWVLAGVALLMSPD